MQGTDITAGTAGPRVAFALALVYLIWGSTYLGIRFALEGGFPPFLLGGMRFTIAGALMFAVLRWRGVPLPSRAQWGNAAVMGVLLLMLGNGMVNLAEKTVPSGIAAVAVASAPLWMGVFAAIRGERPNKLEWIGLGIGFLGVVWLNSGNSLSAAPRGLLALLVASVAWSFGSIWSRGRDLPSPFMAAAAQMLCGGLVMCVAGLAFGERMQALPTHKGIAAFLYLLVFGSVVAFSAYIWLLHHVRPALAGSYAYVNPAIAVALGAWLAGERFGMHELVAMGVILLGVVGITLAKSFRQKPRQPKPPLSNAKVPA